MSFDALGREFPSGTCLEASLLRQIDNIIAECFLKCDGLGGMNHLSLPHVSPPDPLTGLEDLADPLCTSQCSQSRGMKTSVPW